MTYLYTHCDLSPWLVCDYTLNLALLLQRVSFLYHPSQGNRQRIKQTNDGHEHELKSCSIFICNICRKGTGFSCAVVTTILTFFTDKFSWWKQPWWINIFCVLSFAVIKLTRVILILKFHSGNKTCIFPLLHLCRTTQNYH